ncbi:MAG: hypothetical protein JW940_02990 [Polyangiaceae bacterium]|nr:hypothetical protein [Polyangiaceae bacterium]
MMEVPSVGVGLCAQPHARRRARGIGLICAAALLPLACGSDRTGSSLEVEDGAGADSRQISATWTYRSTEVDVDIILSTKESSKSCATTGVLVMDEALAPIERYVLEQTDCATLRLTDSGDIVLYGQATGYDWAEEQLDVDTDRETIELGPCTPQDSTSPVRFTLSAPDCGNDCTCAQLTRRWGGQAVTLPLGKKCD